MGCAKCKDDVWVCSEGTPDCSQLLAVMPAWNKIGCVELDGGDYYVKCRRGHCEARVEKDTSLDPGWKLLNGGEPLSLAEGWYLLCCAIGSGQPCRTQIRGPYANEAACNGADCASD